MRHANGITTLGIVIIIILLLVLFGAFPGVLAHSYGYGPSGVVALLVVVVVVLILTGRL